ncbi:4-hydroxythreonine-4-phosphate dehydrogenase PdxA [Calothrix sp. 336/3]|uniref:4-hydroxythreonine-4-phosphate dehydrogenase PdxA n=1 Tax=Calothrix sp. 336/3 TaxID=1337936 RepID=UPI0004E2E4A3|nr:4-hydroxythreonine-4-phosphate dehydrogenase PdxA [Calothrix sp. 336/3]AKG24209.1 4-hydroxythreonine-4-phosphate dehydrogenase [Calothrix sp. 336/3]
MSMALDSYHPNKPRLILTQGDPAGIGGEVILKALSHRKISDDYDVTVLGNRDLLIQNYTSFPESIRSNLRHPEELSIINVAIPSDVQEQIFLGRGNAASGWASFAFMEEAIARTLAGEFDGIVTAPIAKSAWKAAGYNYPGQTELLAQKAGVDKFGMLFVARSPHTGWTLRCLLATTHIPLEQVPQTLTPELMSKKLDLLIECLEEDFGIVQGRITIAGLNPHSGEEGQLGTEEQEILLPWLEKARDRYPHFQLDGFIPPDTMWVKPGQAWYGNSQIANIADAYLALYHDQGLIPVKLMGFDRAVNTSIGLPFVRTSPDHGTAFDIAGQGMADDTSMQAAIQFAAELVTQRKQRKIYHQHI